MLLTRPLGIWVVMDEERVDRQDGGFEGGAAEAVIQLEV